MDHGEEDRINENDREHIDTHTIRLNVEKNIELIDRIM